MHRHEDKSSKIKSNRILYSYIHRQFIYDVKVVLKLAIDCLLIYLLESNKNKEFKTTKALVFLLATYDMMMKYIINRY